jgi:hypothetical protein
MPGTRPGMTIRVVERRANLYPGETHRDEPPLAWCDVILASKINAESQSLFHALLFCYIRGIPLT